MTDWLNERANQLKALAAIGAIFIGLGMTWQAMAEDVQQLQDWAAQHEKTARQQQRVVERIIVLEQLRMGQPVDLDRLDAEEAAEDEEEDNE